MLSVVLTLALAQVLRPVGVYAEQSNLPSPVYSAWWIGSTNVTQQWGCTIVPAEDAIIPANHSCTGSPPPGYSWHWHHGVDLDDNSTYPNGVGCTDGQYGPGTTIYAGGTGTVSKIATGQFQINPAGSNTYVNLVHEQTVLNDPSTGRPIALGAQVTVGEAVVMTGNIAPAGGSSYGCHLHFEVAIGYTYLGWNGTGYDVDPTPYLQQGTGPAIAYGISMQLFATSGSMGGGAIWNDSYPVTGGFNGWGGFNSLGIPNPSVNFVGAPTGIVYNNQIEVFAIGTNGTMWNYSYAPGSCGGNGWCAPWSMTGNGPLGASSGVAVLPWSNGMQLFAIGSDGAMRDYSYSPTQCPTGPPNNGWCTAWSMSANGSLGTSSGVAVLPWNNGMQLFAIGSDGAMRDYSYSSTQCPAGPPNNGWCTAWSMSGNGPLSASGGVAVLPWNNGMQLFAIGTDGAMRDYSYSPTQCPTGPPNNGWCTSWGMSGNGQLGASSGVAVLPWNNGMQLFAIGTDAAMRDYSYSPMQCPTGPPNNGWCTAWSMSGNGSLTASSGVAVLPWNNGMQLFAIGADAAMRDYSYAPTQCPTGPPNNGWCTAWSMGGPFTNV